MEKVFRYTVTEEDVGALYGSVGLILKKRLGLTGQEISRAKFYEHGIFADGRRCRVSEKVAAGAEITVTLPENPDKASKIIPVAYPLKVLYEDEDLIFVDKPAGVVSHPSPGHYRDTMANYIAFHLQQEGLSSVCRIVGRLDKETSGVLIFAKTREAAGRFSGDGRKKYTRTYYCIAEGVVEEDEGEITTGLEKTPDVLLLRQVREDGEGDLAKTRYRVLKRSGSHTLLEVTIETGRTHQIRLHMAHIGHPLAGDTLYGSEAHLERLDHIKSMAEGEARALLHAGSVEMIHPFTGARIFVTAPYPEDFRESLVRYGLEPGQD